jgi:uncharacterized membrane protein YkoI
MNTIKMLTWGVIIAFVVVSMAIAGVEYGKEQTAPAAPLSQEQAIQLVTAQHPGKVLATEREQEDGKAVYEITVGDANSGSREFTVDAKSGQVTEGTEEGE